MRRACTKDMFLASIHEISQRSLNGTRKIEVKQASGNWELSVIGTNLTLVGNFLFYSLWEQ